MRILTVWLCLIFSACASISEKHSFLQEVLSLEATADEKAQMILDAMTYEEKIRVLSGEGWKDHGTVKRLGLPTISYEDATAGIFLNGINYPAPLVAAASCDTTGKMSFWAPESTSTECLLADGILNISAKIRI